MEASSLAPVQLGLQLDRADVVVVLDVQGGFHASDFEVFLFLEVHCKDLQPAFQVLVKILLRFHLVDEKIVVVFLVDLELHPFKKCIFAYARDVMYFLKYRSLVVVLVAEKHNFHFLRWARLAGSASGLG